MTFLRPLLAATALALALLSGCAGPTVHYDYDAKTPFTAYQTFAWQPPQGPDRPGEFNNAIVRGRVQRAVEAELASKGFRQADDAANPDFLVNYYPLWEPGRSQQVHMGLGFGMGPVGVGFAAPVGDPHREARAGLVLEFQDGRTRTVVWKATAPDALQGSDSPQEADASVKEAIHAMLNHFPPPGK
jgi:hypothetical protein